MPDLVPMTIADTRVADNIKQRHVLAELFDLRPKPLGNVARSGSIREDLRQLVHRAEHVANLLVDDLRIQVLERSCSM